MSPETRNLVESAVRRWRETGDGPMNVLRLHDLCDAIAAYLEDVLAEDAPHESKDN